MTFHKEYRACGLDQGAAGPDHGQWRTDRALAVRDLAALDADRAPYARTWVEARIVSTPIEVVRVVDDEVAVAPGAEAFLRALDEGRAA